METAKSKLVRIHSSTTTATEKNLSIEIAKDTLSKFDRNDYREYITNVAKKMNRPFTKEEKKLSQNKKDS